MTRGRWSAFALAAAMLGAAQGCGSSAYAGSALPKFAHVFMVTAEDTGYGEVIGQPDAPYVNSLLAHSALATNYHAIVHPGYGDYFALTAGDLLGAPSQCTPLKCSSGALNITDRLEPAGITWRAYMDGMQTPCETQSTPTYEAQHDIFVYYDDIRNNAARCRSGVVPLGRLAGDLAAPQTAPDYVWLEPSGCDAMDNCNRCQSRDCSVAAGDRWLADTLTTVFQSATWRQGKSVMFLTWEEDNFTAGNHVATLVMGMGVRAGTASAAPYDHYSLLKTIETAWKLRPFTSKDAGARPMTDVFKEG
jgi:phosphatidylinositol-3-phosphatase